jgi:hypothetical protein
VSTILRSNDVRGSPAAKRVSVWALLVQGLRLVGRRGSRWRVGDLGARAAGRDVVGGIGADAGAGVLGEGVSCGCCPGRR